MHKTFLIICSFLVLSGCGLAQDIHTQQQPNIVLFVADDLATEDIGPYGNKVVRTPHLDRLANESLLFTRAFAPSPTCGPSRSSIFTGLLPFRHGAHSNHSGVKEATKSLVHYMQPLGYQVAIAGKLHVGPEEVFPFEKVSKTNIPEPGYEDNPGLHYDLNMEPVDNWLSKRERKEPFVLVVADHSPHVVWPEESDYDPAKIDVPSRHIDTEDYRKSRARYYADITKMDGNVGKLLKSLKDHELDQNTIVVFVSDQGPQFPFGKWSLYDYGIQSPLLVRWPREIEAGTKSKALVSLTDLVPTFVEMAGGTAPEGIDGKSLLPVIKGEVDSIHEMIFASHTGDRKMNRAPMRMLRTDKYKYILNLAPEIRYTTHMDKAKDHDGGREYWDSWREASFKNEHAAAVLWKYHNRPGEELYDVISDPLEQHNLAKDPAYNEIIKEFRVEMNAIRKQQGDFETGPEELDNNPSQKGKRHKPVAPYIFLN